MITKNRNGGERRGGWKGPSLIKKANSNLKCREGICLLDINWELVPQERCLKAKSDLFG